MGIDASIPLRARTFDFSGRQGMADAVKMNSMLDDSKLRKLQVNQAQKQADQQSTFDEGMQGATNPDGSLNPDKVVDAYNQSGQQLKGHQFKQNWKAAEAAGRGAQLDFMDKTWTMRAKLLSSATDPVTYQAMREQGLEVFGEEMMADVPLEYDEKWVQSELRKTLDTKDQLKHELDIEKANETKRHNKATENISRNKSSKETTNKTADANFFRRAAAEHYGGFVNPDTGSIQGLDKEAAQKVNEIAAQAARIYKENPGIDQNSAFSKAAEERRAAPEAPAVDDADPEAKVDSFLNKIFGP